MYCYYNMLQAALIIRISVRIPFRVLFFRVPTKGPQLWLRS